MLLQVNGVRKRAPSHFLPASWFFEQNYKRVWHGYCPHFFISCNNFLTFISVKVSDNTNILPCFFLSILLCSKSNECRSSNVYQIPTNGPTSHRRSEVFFIFVPLNTLFDVFPHVSSYNSAFHVCCNQDVFSLIIHVVQCNPHINICLYNYSCVPC